MTRDSMSHYVVFLSTADTPGSCKRRRIKISLGVFPYSFQLQDC